MLNAGQPFVTNRLVDVFLVGSTEKICVDGYAAYRTHFLPFCF